jgi:hypothetical protein
MSRTLTFAQFPVEYHCKDINPAVLSEDQNDLILGQNLKKEFKIPKTFFVPNKDT